MANNTTFLKITNGDIYAKLEGMESKLDTSVSKVNKIAWLAGSALSISTFVIVLLIDHIRK